MKKLKRGNVTPQSKKILNILIREYFGVDITTIWSIEKKH